MLDHNTFSRLRQQVKDSMEIIDKKQLPDKHKAWMYEHGLLTKLIWSLTLYEIPTTAVEVLNVPWANTSGDRLVFHPVSLTLDSMGKTTKLKLPLSSVLEEFKVSKTRLVVTLKDSTGTSSRNRDKNRQKVVSEPSSWTSRDKTEAQGHHWKTMQGQNGTRQQ